MLGCFGSGSWILDAATANALATLAVLVVPLLALEWFEERARDGLAVLELSLLPRTALIAMLTLMVARFGNTGSIEFIYFQF